MVLLMLGASNINIYRSQHNEFGGFPSTNILVARMIGFLTRQQRTCQPSGAQNAELRVSSRLLYGTTNMSLTLHLGR